MSEFDPTQDVRLDTQGLRVLAHPLRLKMLSRLRLHGPATPSMLARDLGESSGATSYHLRQLLAYGFVVEDAGRGTKRERWFRSAHRSTTFDMKLDDDNRAMGGEYLRAVARNYAERILRYSDTVDVPDDTPWAEVWDISDWNFALTPEQATQLRGELHGLLDRYRAMTRPEDADTRTVVAQVQVIPVPGPA